MFNQFIATEPYSFDDVTSSPITAVTPSQDVVRLGRQLPSDIYLGCASWNFPGWKGIVWGDTSGVEDLTRRGLSAYCKHPILRAVGVDWSFFGTLNEMAYAAMAQQVDERFRFLVKAPQTVTDAVKRDPKGRFRSLNQDFLDIHATMHEFVYPVINGLGENAGPLVFQLSPIPRPLLPTQAECYAYIDRIAQFFADLPKEVEGESPTYAVEIRTPAIYTKRLLNALRGTGVRLVVGVHPSMPDVIRQTAALRYFEDPEAEGEEWTVGGTLVVRWSLNPIQRHGVAKMTYAPFNRIVHPDPATRAGLVQLVSLAHKSGQKSFVITNNKAEGSAPLTMIDLARDITAKLSADKNAQMDPRQF